MAKQMRPGSKKMQLIQMLNRSSGAKIGAIETKLGWQGPAVQCAAQAKIRQVLAVLKLIGHRSIVEIVGQI